MHSLIQERKGLISELCKRFNVSKLEVFGSAARSEDFVPGHSDIDFAVEFFRPRKMGPLEEFFDFQSELSKVLGQEVDLIELGAVKNPYVRESIDKDRELVFAA